MHGIKRREPQANFQHRFVVVEGRLKLVKLGRLAGGIDDATVSNRVRQFETAYTKRAKLKDLVKQPLRYLEKEKM